MIPCLKKLSYLMLVFAFLMAWLAWAGTYIFLTIEHDQSDITSLRCLVDSESYTFVISLLIMNYMTMVFHILLAY